MPRNSVVAIAVLLALAGQARPAQAGGFIKAAFHKLRPRLAPKEVMAALKFQRLRWLQPENPGVHGKSASLGKNYRKAKRQESRRALDRQVSGAFLLGPPSWALSAAKWAFRACALIEYALAVLPDRLFLDDRIVSAAIGTFALGVGWGLRVVGDTILNSSRIQAIADTLSLLPKSADPLYVEQLGDLKSEIEKL